MSSRIQLPKYFLLSAISGMCPLGSNWERIIFILKMNKPLATIMIWRLPSSFTIRDSVGREILDESYSEGIWILVCPLQCDKNRVLCLKQKHCAENIMLDSHKQISLILKIVPKHLHWYEDYVEKLLKSLFYFGLWYKNT